MNFYPQDPAIEFLSSLVFTDSKRPITIDVLRRLSIVEVARHLGRLHELQYLMHSRVPDESTDQQMVLLMETKQKYRVREN